MYFQPRLAISSSGTTPKRSVRLNRSDVSGKTSWSTSNLASSDRADTSPGRTRNSTSPTRTRFSPSNTAVQITRPPFLKSSLCEPTGIPLSTRWTCMKRQGCDFACGVKSPLSRKFCNRSTGESVSKSEILGQSVGFVRFCDSSVDKTCIMFSSTWGSVASRTSLDLDDTRTIPSRHHLSHSLHEPDVWLPLDRRTGRTTNPLTLSFVKTSFDWLMKSQIGTSFGFHDWCWDASHSSEWSGFSAHVHDAISQVHGSKRARSLLSILLSQIYFK